MNLPKNSQNTIYFKDKQNFVMLWIILSIVLEIQYFIMTTYFTKTYV